MCSKDDEQYKYRGCVLHALQNSRLGFFHVNYYHRWIFIDEKRKPITSIEFDEIDATIVVRPESVKHTCLKMTAAELKSTANALKRVGAEVQPGPTVSKQPEVLLEKPTISLEIKAVKKYVATKYKCSVCKKSGHTAATHESVTANISDDNCSLTTECSDVEVHDASPLSHQAYSQSTSVANTKSDFEKVNLFQYTMPFLTSIKMDPTPQLSCKDICDLPPWVLFHMKFDGLEDSVLEQFLSSHACNVQIEDEKEADTWIRGFFKKHGFRCPSHSNCNSEHRVLGVTDPESHFIDRCAPLSVIYSEH